MKTKLLISCLAAGLIAFTGISSAQKQLQKTSMLTEDELAGNSFHSENNLRASSGFSTSKKISFLKGISPVTMGCDTIKTTFAGGNGNAGNMFDINALSNIVINAFEGNITGNGTIEIYYKTGTYVGSETTAAAWTLIGSTMVTSAGTGVPTLINIPINISISAGQTCGFYFTGNSTGATVAYTNGTAVGAVFVSNSALQITQGVGKAYPFGTTNTPRVWNGIVHYCDSGSTPPPSAMFKGDTLIQCVGGIVTFQDLSTSGPTSWNWSFPGGNPSTSTVQNPVITYTASGVYNVRLIVSNVNGNDTLTMTNYVKVLNNIGYAPVTEDFEAATFPSTSFYLFDDGSDGITWMRDTLASGFGTGTASMYFDNFTSNVAGTRDAVRTQPIDFFGSSPTPYMTFDVAYSPYSATFTDTLAIYASSNCGKNFSLLYLKGGTKLSADSSITTTSFVPTPAQWRKDSISLTSVAGQPDVIISFENRAHYGNALYLDNINIVTGASAGVSELENTFDIVVSPNPMNQKSIISLKNTHANNNEAVIVNVYELTGNLVKTLKPTATSQGRWTAELNRENLAAGMYFIQISESGKNAGTSKLVIE